jgi:hypothetical protein
MTGLVALPAVLAAVSLAADAMSARTPEAGAAVREWAEGRE